MLMIQNCRYVKPMPADMRGVKRMRRRGKEQTLISELIQGRFMIHSECNTPHPICVAWYSPPYWTVVHLSSFSGTWSNKRKLNTSKMHSLPYWRTKCSMIPASAVADHRFSVFTNKKTKKCLPVSISTYRQSLTKQKQIVCSAYRTENCH